MKNDAPRPPISYRLPPGRPRRIACFHSSEVRASRPLRNLLTRNLTSHSFCAADDAVFATTQPTPAIANHVTSREPLCRKITERQHSDSDSTAPNLDFRGASSCPSPPPLRIPVGEALTATLDVPSVPFVKRLCGLGCAWMLYHGLGTLCWETRGLRIKFEVTRSVRLGSGCRSDTIVTQSSVSNP